MEIIHNIENTVFYAMEGDDRAGRLEYMKDADGDLQAAHTIVEKDWEGQGVARKLLDALVAYAETEGLKIIPQCSYVGRAFEKDEAKYKKYRK